MPPPFNCRSCLDDLQQSREHIDDILANTLGLLDSLSHLAKEFNTVESQTSNFEKQCEGLLAAQERDTKLANGIQTNLHYYEFLDPASRKLNAPGAGNTVRDEEFSDMLRRLDVCLDYMETHVSKLRSRSPSCLIIVLSNVHASLSKKKQRSTGPGTACFLLALSP